MLKKIIVLSALLGSVSGFSASSPLISRLGEPVTQMLIAKKEAEGLHLISVNDANNLSKYVKGTAPRAEDRIRILFARSLSEGYAQQICQITYKASPEVSCKEKIAAIQPDTRMNLDQPTE